MVIHFIQLQKNNISVNDLKRLNNITSDFLKIGQKLLVKDIGVQNYIVKAGDTFFMGNNE